MAKSAKRARRGGQNIGLFGDDIASLGDPFGKELTLFNLDTLFDEGNGAIQAKFIKSFGEYKMPMGVEAMSEEVIVCNMNNGTVEFTDFDGNTNLTLPTGQGRGPKKVPRTIRSNNSTRLPYFGGRQSWMSRLLGHWRIHQNRLP